MLMVAVAMLAASHSAAWLWTNREGGGVGQVWQRRAGLVAPERSRQAVRLLSLAPEAGTRAQGAAVARALVKTNAASPYEWTALAAALRAAGEEPASRYAMDRARQLGPSVAPVQMQAAHYYAAEGDLDAVLAAGRRVLELTRNYDTFLLHDYVSMGAGADLILDRGVPPQPAALAAVLAFSIDNKDLYLARQTWRWMGDRGAGTEELLASYCGLLMAAGLPAEAWDAWWRFHAGQEAPGPTSPQLFNGGLEAAPRPGPFDWAWSEVEGAAAGIASEGVHSGRGALEVRFNGERNLAYRHASIRLVAGPGRYALGAWVAAQGITTNEGVGVELSDGARTLVSVPSLTGTQPWSHVGGRFALASRSLLTLTVVRRPSAKFDNKIAGVFRLDDVSLERIE
jgi:hypothetical protein